VPAVAIHKYQQPQQQQKYRKHHKAAQKQALRVRLDLFRRHRQFGSEAKSILP
jgi:hypothetical protein